MIRMNENIHFIINKKGYGEENWQLRQRIHKAIEYINEKIIPYGDEWNWDSSTIGDMINNLLNILKGSDKE